MVVSQSISVDSPHSDLITSLSFSPQSTHLVTSSLDSTIRIVERNPTTQQYDLNPVNFKAHEGPVLTTCWSPPQFGLILATAGIDGTIKIWRQPPQQQALKSSSSNNDSNNNNNRFSKNRNWLLTCTITESNMSGGCTIRKLSFNPSAGEGGGGLKLASISSDSRLRCWECLDPVSGGHTKEWSLLHDIDLTSLPLVHLPIDSNYLTSNNNSDFSSSSNLSTTPGLVTSETNSTTTTTTTTTTATATTTSTAGGTSNDGSRRISTIESDGGWSLTWCREHWWGERLAVSAGSNGIIRLFHFPTTSSNKSDGSSLPHPTWSNFLNLFPTRQILSSSNSSSSTESPPPPPPPLNLPPTCSLEWAPPSGRSFQLLASGSKDSKVRVYKIFPPNLNKSSEEVGVWTAQLDVELDESNHQQQRRPNNNHQGNSPNSSGITTASSLNNNNNGNVASSNGAGGGIGATKVEWNVTGTVLSTSGGEDGIVRLWKSTYTGQWRQITSLKTQVSSSSSLSGE